MARFPYFEPRLANSRTISSYHPEDAVIAFRNFDSTLAYFLSSLRSRSFFHHLRCDFTFLSLKLQLLPFLSWPCSPPSQPLRREVACREISRQWRSRERVQSLPLSGACVHSAVLVDPPLSNEFSLIVSFDLYPPRSSHPSGLGRTSSIGGGGGSGQQRVQRLAAEPGSVSLVTAPHKGIAL